MHITYIAPRYHTNQIAVVDGWQAGGDTVQYIVRTKGPIEDCANIQPVTVPYARSFLLFQRLYMKLHSGDSYAQDIALRYGYPAKRALKKALTEQQTDLVILRERSIYSILCYRVCRKLGIRTLMYNQSPLWELPENIHHDIAHRLMDRLLPIPRITPVRKKDNSLEKKVQTRDAYFVPFVTELHAAPEERTYLADGKVHILEIGRFERRKNHLLMLQAFEQVRRVLPHAVLTIVGEVSDSFHEAYLKEVEQYVKAHGLSDSVQILLNYDYARMGELYLQADLFVLASTGEPAAISPLEAMSYSLPAISSTGNGTADYIEDGVTGHIFKDNDAAALAEAILDIVSDTERLTTMGRAAYEHIRSNYLFENYYEALMQAVQTL